MLSDDSDDGFDDVDDDDDEDFQPRPNQRKSLSLKKQGGQNDLRNLLSTLSRPSKNLPQHC